MCSRWLGHWGPPLNHKMCRCLAHQERCWGPQEVRTQVEGGLALIIDDDDVLRQKLLPHQRILQVPPQVVGGGGLAVTRVVLQCRRAALVGASVLPEETEWEYPRHSPVLQPGQVGALVQRQVLQTVMGELAVLGRSEDGGVNV